MSSLSFQEALGRGVLVFDGAMGTEIYRHHVFTNRCFDELCLSDPKLIGQIHREYCEAGADVLTTNTFGANRVALAKFGLAERLREIIRAGARLAREVADAAERPVYVAGSIGPLPAQPQYEATVEEMIVEQAGPDGRRGRFHPLRDAAQPRRPLERLAAAMRQLPGRAVRALVRRLSVTAKRPPANRSSECWPRCRPSAPQPIAWGMNCGGGPDGLLGRSSGRCGLPRCPWSCSPMPAYPKRWRTAAFTSARPNIWPSYAKRYVGLGAAAVGGCCGTTPDHIREVAGL